MIQTGLIQSAHDDLVTDTAYDFYGLKLATCSLDQRIKVWQLDEANGTWSVEDDWKAHDAAVSKLSWAHPEFGSIIASSSFDRSVKVWERRPVRSTPANDPHANGAASNGSLNSASAITPGAVTTRWVEMGMMLEARGTVRAVEFASHQFGLKLASISTDNQLRIYECLDIKTWTCSEEIDIPTLPLSATPSSLSHAHTRALATPTQTNATLDGASASLVAQALQQSQSTSMSAGASQMRPGLGSREADGGWCLSWCKERYWGEVLAVGAGITGTIKIIQLSASRRPSTILTLDHAPRSSSPGDPDAVETPTPHAVTSVAWAPSCGRSFHLIATGSRDGHVRIWRVKPGAEEDDMDTDRAWSASIVADFDHHKAAVGRVEWNITGTVLSSAGNDGRIRLWKATTGQVWRPAGSIGVEQAEEHDNADIDMGDGSRAD